MNTDKLLKAIQILIREELKLVLPKIIKEAVKIESKKIIEENKKLRELISHTSPTDTDTFMDIDVTENPTKKLSKNPVLNEILNNTEPFNQKSENLDKTMVFDSSSAPGGIDTLRQQMGAKFGHGVVETQSQPKTGIGANTGNEALDKALNRDYTQLVKRFKR